MKFAASILAGGAGRRMGQDLPKQFLEIRGRPILVHTLAAFARANLFESIHLAIHPDWVERLADILHRWDLSGTVTVVPGGPTRQASSRAVLDALEARLAPRDGVLIHDAARCLVDGELLARCVEGVQRHGAVTAAMPVTDTIAVADGMVIASVPERERLFRIQTPQGFQLGLILAAHRAARERGVVDATDDAQLVMALGHPVRIVPGSAGNLKISTPEDLAVAAAIIEWKETSGGRPDRPAV